MMYIVGHVIGLQHLLEVAVELEMGIAKYITNYLNSIVNYKFGNQCIYCNLHKNSNLRMHNKLYNHNSYYN